MYSPAVLKECDKIWHNIVDISRTTETNDDDRGYTLWTVGGQQKDKQFELFSCLTKAIT